MSLHDQDPYLPLFAPPPATVARKKPNSAGPALRVDYSLDCKAWLAEYPKARRHAGGFQDVLRAYTRARQMIDAGTLVLALRQYVAVCALRGTEARYICHPATYLNNGRWTDEYPELERGQDGINGSGGDPPGTHPGGRGRADTLVAAGLKAGARVGAGLSANGRRQDPGQS